jgi:hypothetical protein
MTGTLFSKQLCRAKYLAIGILFSNTIGGNVRILVPTIILSTYV